LDQTGYINRIIVNGITGVDFSDYCIFIADSYRKDQGTCCCTTLWL